MPWVKLDDSFIDNRKFLRAGPLAGYMHIAAIAWCNQNLTDGVVPRAQPARLAAWHLVNDDLSPEVVGVIPGHESAVCWPGLVSTLVEQGLWHEREDGDYEIHDYSEYQPSRAEVLKARAKLGKHRSAAGKKGGKQTGSKPEANRKQKGGQNGSPVPVPLTSTTDVVDASPMCELLVELMEGNGSKGPAITKTWRDAERLLLSADGRDPVEAERLVRWCQADSFWRGNIRSMPTFREKYDTLRLQSQRPATGAKPGASASWRGPGDRAIAEAIKGGAA